MQVVNCLDYSEETLQALEQLWPAICAPSFSSSSSFLFTISFVEIFAYIITIYQLIAIDVLAKQAAFGGDQFVLVLRAPPASVSQVLFFLPPSLLLFCSLLHSPPPPPLSFFMLFFSHEPFLHPPSPPPPPSSPPRNPGCCVRFHDALFQLGRF